MAPFLNEAVFVRLTLRRVHFGSPQHFIVIPVAAVLGNAAFDAHALGINILTGGKAFGSRNYETTVQSVP
jgi:hypothetical protein